MSIKAKRQRAKLPPVIELAYELDKVEAEIEGLKYYVEHEPARKLVPLIRKTGHYKGEIVDLTPAQYKKLMGRSPKTSIINKKTKKIPWELALDEAATELGYKNDEELKKAAEDVGHKIGRIKQLERNSGRLSSDLKQAQKQAKVELIATEVHINGLVKAKDIFLGTRKLGTVVRIPSEWRVVYTENGIEPLALEPEAALARVPYSKDIKRAVKEAYAIDEVKKPRGEQKKQTKVKKKPSKRLKFRIGR